MKKLCKINRKEIRQSMPFVLSVVGKPRYICEQCARVSSDKALLCKPVKIKDWKQKK